jgi:hypothetical protein
MEFVIMREGVVKYIMLDHKLKQDIKGILNQKISITEFQCIAETIDKKLLHPCMWYPRYFYVSELNRLDIKYVNVHEYLLGSEKRSSTAVECYVSDIILMCVENDIHDPQFIMEYRYYKDPQEYFNIYLEQIECDLFLLDKHLYFESELIHLFKFNSFFECDFRKDSKIHKLKHINIYILNEKVRPSYKQTNNKKRKKNVQFVVSDEPIIFNFHLE